MTTFTAMPKYEAYKDSGVEWIGEIPDDWGIKKLSHLFSNIGSGTTPATGNISFYNGNISWLQTGDLTDGVINSTSKTISERALKIHSTLKQYKAGSLVVAMYGATIGKVGLLNISTATNQACCVLEKTDSVDMRFAFYLFMGFKSNIVAMGYGGGQPNISQDLIRNLRFPFPNQQLQTAIANFLDEKTAKIDEAIAIKEKQIELLKERKQIIIQQAVTQGLDPTVPMKDSGVEWIGKIPAHWSVKKIKFIFDKIKTGTTPNTANHNYFDGNINWFGPKDMNDPILINSERKVSALAILKKEAFVFPADSILVVGIGATSGKTSYLADSASFNQQVTGFNSRKIINKYMYYVISSISSLMLGVANYTTLPILNNEFFKNFILPIPDNAEQIDIVEFIESEVDSISEMIHLLDIQIEKLKEYKTTLINSAVTGKIKVV